MQDSLFTKIINGEIPCDKIYEDTKTFAFLDIHPKQPGHVLVVPTHQVEFIWDLGANDYAALMESVQKVGLHVRNVLQPGYVGVMVEGLGVPHAHVHVFPFADAEQYYLPSDQSTEPDFAALSAMAQKLRMEDEL